MKTAIIVSSKDLAGMNIKNHLVKIFHETPERVRDEAVYSFNHKIKLYTVDIDTIHTENIDSEIEADMFLFATRHKSEKGTPSLSVHSPGNWKSADYGGNEKELALCPASYLKKAVGLLKKNNTIGFDVIQECTHHGPSLKKPCLFIEIGSTEKEWVRDDAGKIISRVIIELLTTPTIECESAFGIGGLHTTPNFKKIQLNSDIAVGHVCPKYNLVNLDKEMILQALEKTKPKSGIVIVDWKGLGEHKERIKTILDEMKIEWKRTQDY